MNSPFRHPHLRTNQEGIALVVATFFLLVTIVILTIVTSRTVQQSGNVDQFQRYEHCMLGIETALARSMSNLDAGQSGSIGDPVSQSANTPPAFPTDLGAVPTVPGKPSVYYIVEDQNWYTDGIDNDGNGVSDNQDSDEFGMHTLYVMAREDEAVRCVEVVVAGTDVNVWNNVIFAGDGQAGGVIQGNVSIHGSVHLLGGNLPNGGVAIDALDLNGASSVHNNYADQNGNGGLPANFGSRIPNPGTTAIDGQEAQTLKAKLRVKHGLVNTGGNAEIGSATNYTNNGVFMKGKVDGVYTNDGFTGTQAVYSDNGIISSYDLGDRVAFPVLSDDYRDPTSTPQYSPVTNPNTGSNYTHQEYFEQLLSGTTTNTTDGHISGALTISSGSNTFWSSRAEVTSTMMIDAIKAGNLTAKLAEWRTTYPDIDYLCAFTAPIPVTTTSTTVNKKGQTVTTTTTTYINPDNVMRINGQITIDGNLTINTSTLSYTGKAAILVKGDIDLESNLYTQNEDGTVTNSFPYTACLGLMATNNMKVGMTSQLEIMGAFYAQNTITSSKQTNVMGSYVSTYFDIQKNVPSIYQVKDLPTNLPDGMIGKNPIFYMERLSWREITPA